MLTSIASSLVQRGTLSVPRLTADVAPSFSSSISTTALNAALSPGSIAASAVATLRGGALDMARENQSMGVLSSYGVVTVLILNCALRLYTSTQFKKDGSKYEWVAPSLFSIFSGICVISGAFTGVMFQLMNIYSKTALAMGTEAGYLAFKAATTSFRRLGFHTFLTCLATFVGTFLLSFYAKIKDDTRLGSKILYLMVFLACMGAVGIKTILDLATTHIFQAA